MMSENKMSRRDLLTFTGFGAFIIANFASSVGFLRFLIPNAVYEPDRRFKIGYPEDIPLNGYIEKPDQAVMIFRDESGFHAISTVCTHLGCIVKKVEAGFDCPCHGSRFDKLGVPYAGPAPTPLTWHKISVAPDGQLIVDLNVKVKIETKFRV